MRSSFSFAGLLLQAALTIAKPYLYEKDGMVYNVLPREDTLAQNEAFIEARGMSLEQANVADSCMGSYNLIATGSGPYPTGKPDPNFDFFEFCSSYIRPTKTYTVSLRPTSPPVVTITVTASKSTSTKPTTTDSSPLVTITVTATKPTTTSSPPPPPTTEKSTTEESPVITITVTASKTTTSKTTTSSPPPPPTTTKSNTSVTYTTSTTSITPSLLPTTPIATPTPTFVVPPAATGSLCPSAVQGQICGTLGWGYAENNLYSGSPISAPECHQLCLANPDCKSFQTQDSSYAAPACNLYKVDSSGNNTIVGASSPYVFYDRGCPDYAPAACVKVAPPLTTAKPTLSVGLGLAKRQRGWNTQTLPWFLGPFGSETISEICTCIITLAPPAISYTTTIRG